MEALKKLKKKKKKTNNENCRKAFVEKIRFLDI